MALELENIKAVVKDYWSRISGRYKTVTSNHPWILKTLKWGSISVLSLLVGLFIFSILVYKGLLGPLPSYAELKNIQNYNASEVYAEGGELLGKYYIENRISTDFEEISPYVIEALIATEDARFFEHRGIDLRALGRVLIKSLLLSRASSGGGSTLSQQLAKNLYPRRKYWMMTMPINKLKESFIARRLENTYTKEELLRLYLNTVPFSENTYGIKTAAQRFYQKAPSNLTIEEAALLVGTLKANSYYNPAKHPQRAQERRNTVLHQMAKYEYLTNQEVDSLVKTDVKLNYQAEGSNKGIATYFREHLRQEVEDILEQTQKADGSSYNLYTDGLRIYTTIDADMQHYAEESIHYNMPILQKSFHKDWSKGLPWKKISALESAVRRSDRFQSLEKKGIPNSEIQKIFATPVEMTIFDWKEGQKKVKISPIDSVKYYLSLLNTGLLAAEPTTGKIKAWVGGINHAFFQYDHVKSQRQMGSTIKPVVYAAALEAGMLPCEYTPNRLVTYTQYDDWQPRNADGEYTGAYSMEGALSHSINTVTVEVSQRTTINDIRKLAKNMGVSGYLPEEPSIVLGVAEASVWDMTNIYGAFALGGKKTNYHYLTRIENRHGQVIYEATPTKVSSYKRVLDSDKAAAINKMLQTAINEGTGKRIRTTYNIQGQWAGKTGTTQNQSDGWFVGYNPKLVTAVWVGAETPQIHFKSLSRGQGAKTALPIWGGFMARIQKNKKYRSITRAQFPPLNDTLAAMMDCPPFLDEMPIIADYWDDDYEEQVQFMEAMQHLSPEDRHLLLEKNQRRKKEKLSEYSQRIEKKNQKMLKKRARKEKMKGWWDELYYGNDKQ